MLDVSTLINSINLYSLKYGKLVALNWNHIWCTFIILFQNDGSRKAQGITKIPSEIYDNIGSYFSLNWIIYTFSFGVGWLVTICTTKYCNTIFCFELIMEWFWRYQNFDDCMPTSKFNKTNVAPNQVDITLHTIQNGYSLIKSFVLCNPCCIMILYRYQVTR